ncbi:MAG: acetolactate synthase-1/2/3 large subunit [Planctomycetota bacterium]|jgi:acetolactate synthase-1/2/3 large subunit
MQSGGVTVIHINFSSAEVDAVYFSQIEVVGDIANSVWQITEQLQKQEHWDDSRLLEIRATGKVYEAEGVDAPRYPVHPQQLVAEVRKAIEGEGIIALDNGVYKIWFARNYRATSSSTVLSDNALATMGAGLPSAIGAKLVYPDR